MKATITTYLNGFDLDIRKSGNARFMDQKCTPDVICFIADCVLNAFGEGDEFTSADIWESQYFAKNVLAIYNKPNADNPTAQHEYDKFIQQPLKMLAYAHILDEKKVNRRNVFTVRNIEMLEYIAQRERNTYVFLNCYLEKVLRDSNMWRYFEEYITKSIQQVFAAVDFKELKDRFTRFIIGNTAINGKVEVYRIFPKILNIFAVEHHIKGSEKGRLSTYPFTFSDLMYNRKNWRDLNKDKSMTRQEAEMEDVDIEQQQAFNAYYVQKAIALIRKIHSDSEVKDEWGNGEATQVHHIFPKAQFPQIAHYVENLIRLTPTQHFTKAHPSNNTKVVNSDYQLTCLLFKADSIDKSLKRFGEKYYRKESFIYVVNLGLSQSIEVGLSFADIKTELIRIYNAA